VIQAGEIVAPVQRQFNNALIFDHRADGGILGSEQCDSAGNFDGLANRTERHFEVEPDVGLHLDFDVGSFGAFETLFFGAQTIDGGRKRRKNCRCRPRWLLPSVTHWWPR
jgi:hypothetical protein